MRELKAAQKMLSTFQWWDFSKVQKFIGMTRMQYEQKLMNSFPNIILYPTPALSAGVAFTRFAAWSYEYSRPKGSTVAS